MSRKQANICKQLMERSTFNSGCTVIRDLKLLRLFVEKKSSEFSKVWNKKSKDPIGFDCQHLFFDKFRTCFTTHGFRGTPKQLYKLQPLRVTEKVESAVVFESPLDQTSFLNCQNYSGYRSCLIGVTADGYLFKQDFNTGETLQTVHLSRKYKFKHIFWETDLDRIVIKSVHAKIPPRPVQDNRSSVFHTLMHLALFDIAPLKFVALIPIDKNIFGSGVIDASASLGILFIMHKSGWIQLHSVKEILEEHTHAAVLGQQYIFHNNSNQDNNLRIAACDKQGIVGSYPYGIPVNVHMTYKPTVLLEISSHQHVMSFGGYPWHYMSCPQSQNSVFHVYSLKDHILAGNGILKTEVLSVEPDQAYFHADNSGRLLHVGPHSVRYFKLCESKNQQTEPAVELETCFTVSVKDAQNSSVLEQTTYTSSGRMVRCIPRETYSDPGYETIQDIDYEDELDILVVLSSQDSNKGCIGLYDNQNGTLIREIIIDDWDEESDHCIMMERDLIVHISKTPSKKFSCTLYRLKY